VSNLRTPRADGALLVDRGERSAFVGRQRVGRARQRRRPGARRRPLVLVVLTLLVAAPGLGVAARRVLASPRMRVTSIDVSGAARVPAERIAAAAGIERGVSLFSVDPAAAVARLEALPEIRRAEVVRELPDRVRIVVEERRPFTLVHARGLHWIDEEGYVIGEERRAVAPPAPLISGLDDEIEASPFPSPKARAALGIIHGLLRRGSPLVGQISEIDMGRAEGPVLYTIDGIQVRLGAEDWPDRLARLEGVLAQVATEEPRPSAVDLRFKDQVVFRRGGEP
jgi:cell division protein FtsQ